MLLSSSKILTDHKWCLTLWKILHPPSTKSTCIKGWENMESPWIIQALCSLSLIFGFFLAFISIKTDHHLNHQKVSSCVSKQNNYIYIQCFPWKLFQWFKISVNWSISIFINFKSIYYQWQNILLKVWKPSKIGQDQNILISAFA